MTRPLGPVRYCRGKCGRAITNANTVGVCMYCRSAHVCQICSQPKGETTSRYCGPCRLTFAWISWVHRDNRKGLPVPEGQAERVERYRQRAAERKPLFAA